MKKTAFFVIFILATVLASNSVAPGSIRVSNDARACEWADSVCRSMTLEERVGQLLFPKLVPTQGQSSEAAIRTMVDKYHIGGILFTNGSIEQYAQMTNYAQSISRVPLMMTFDGEWGLSMRIPKTPRFPQNMGLGAIRDTKLLYDYGREMARECKLMGIQVNFAPVADVNSNPLNPVIGYRAFGENPERVASAVVAYSKGLEDGGVISTAKHFPGHGDTDLDSHHALPQVDHEMAILDSVDLLPFVRYIKEGLSGVMVGHLSVPALDASGTPASLSKKITTSLLKDRMKFGGLVFTDALGMEGAKLHDGRNNGLAALMAGADVLLSSSSPANDFNAIISAVNSGKLSQSVVDEACKKILRYKYLVGLSHRPTPIDLKGLEQRINSAEAENINQRLAAASITVLRNDNSLLPLSELNKQSIAIVSIGEKEEKYSCEHGDSVFVDMCRRYANVDIYNLKRNALSDHTLTSIKKHDIVIACVYSSTSRACEEFSRICDATNLVVTLMINPYRIEKFRKWLPKAKAIVLAYDDTPYTQSYAAQAIFGGIDVDGTLPVNLKGIASMGTGLKLKKNRLGFGSPSMVGLNEALNDSVSEICERAVAAGAFPGCRVLIAKDGVVVTDKSFGTIATNSKTPVKGHTLYDLASVSKTIGTLPGVMKAYDLGLFKLDDKVVKHIPGFAADSAKQNITVKQLLFHESAMPPSLNMFMTMMDTATYIAPIIRSKPDATHTIKIQNGAWGATSAKLRTDITSSKYTPQTNIKAAEGIYVGQCTYDTIMQRIYTTPLRKNNNYCYSCLNFCLLMDMEQRLTHQPHQQWMADSIWGPLGAYSICYRPTLTQPLNNIAATEVDNYLRRQLVHGFVHDELAAFSGGVQGNAGVFSNAYDIAKVCQMWLDGGTYGGVRVLSPETVKIFTTSKSDKSRRGLGFDKPDTKNPDNSPTFAGAPASVFGHTGFTGTIFWVDPQQNIIFVFLCNRVNPTRDNSVFSHMNIRPALFEQIYKNLGANTASNSLNK